MEAPVIIAGAGPGGITLALALHQHNIPVHVYEAVPQLRPLGVGINVLPHAIRVLHALALRQRWRKKVFTVIAVRAREYAARLPLVVQDLIPRSADDASG